MKWASHQAIFSSLTLLSVRCDGAYALCRGVHELRRNLPLTKRPAAETAKRLEVNGVDVAPTEPPARDDALGVELADDADGRSFGYADGGCELTDGARVILSYREQDEHVVGEEPPSPAARFQLFRRNVIAGRWL